MIWYFVLGIAFATAMGFWLWSCERAIEDLDELVRILDRLGGGE